MLKKYLALLQPLSNLTLWVYSYILDFTVLHILNLKVKPKLNPDLADDHKDERMETFPAKLNLKSEYLDILKSLKLKTVFRFPRFSVLFISKQYTVHGK